MRRFLASAWFPVLTMLVLAAGTVLSYLFVIRPTGEAIGNAQMHDIAKIAGFAAGPALALLSLVLAFILNGLRRLLRVRAVSWLHPVVPFVSILPWCVFAWAMVMDEPRHTPVAHAVIDFVGRPLFLGCAAALAFIVLCSLLALVPVPSKKK